MMWEYRLEHIKYSNIESLSMDERLRLAELGIDRWEAISMVRGSPGGVEILFKRYTQEYLDSQRKGG